MSSKSCHGINCALHRKSLRKIHSFSCTPTQAKLPEAGLLKVSYMSVRGFKMNVFPQFAAPVIITLRYFPLPFSSNSCTDLENSPFLTLLFLSTSVAHLIHCPLQPGEHSSLALSCNICSRVLRARSSLSPACFISHVVSRSSVTTFRDLLSKNCIRSCFPSFVCSYARA